VKNRHVEAQRLDVAALFTRICWRRLAIHSEFRSLSCAVPPLKRGLQLASVLFKFAPSIGE
jgi:hypothetical protein